MGDPELEAIKQQRLAQLQSQYGNGPQNPEQQKAREEQMRQQEEMKHSMLSQLLNQQARARLNTLKISKPEKAEMVEGMIIRMAQAGRIPGKLDDQQFVSILESLNQQIPKSTSTVKFDRRRAALDSDDDYGLNDDSS
uniref:Putative programmed cell death protein n=1 Tax=Tabanus bromius TaxID=304241 RepID=A0A0K8TQ97_TABBR